MRRKVRPGVPNRPTAYRGHYLLYLRARDIWLILDANDVQISSGITRKHAQSRVHAMTAANPSLAQLSERSTQEK